MSQEHLPIDGIPGRVRRLVESFVETDLVRIRIERTGESIELGRPSVPRRSDGVFETSVADVIAESAARSTVEIIKADLVGIVHLSRPVPTPGEALAADRELAYIEALGIRNPVRSRGAGRIVAVLCTEGDAVDYGRALFELDRG